VHKRLLDALYKCSLNNSNNNHKIVCPRTNPLSMDLSSIQEIHLASTMALLVPVKWLSMSGDYTFPLAAVCKMIAPCSPTKIETFYSTSDSVSRSIFKGL